MSGRHGAARGSDVAPPCRPQATAERQRPTGAARRERRLMPLIQHDSLFASRIAGGGGREDAHVELESVKLPPCAEKTAHLARGVPPSYSEWARASQLAGRFYGATTRSGIGA